jgi:cation:H+ antiporter
MFEELGLLGNCALLLASLLILVLGSELTINNSIKISEMTRLGKTTIGFVLVGFATSLPELSVSVLAVRDPTNVGVSIGNVLGSNIVNIGLVLGICILLVVLKRPRSPRFLLTLAKEEMGELQFGLFIASIVPLSLLYIGSGSRIVGMILLGIFLYYMVQLARTKIPKEKGVAPQKKSSLRLSFLLALLGVSVVVASAFFLVETASFVATSIGIPTVVIGATIVAFGTSIPELATSISSTRKGHFNIALGNIVGSGFINITLILGVSLIASPLAVDMSAFSSLLMFSLFMNLFLWYFVSSEKMSWREGAILLLVYIAFLLISFGIS